MIITNYQTLFKITKEILLASVVEMRRDTWKKRSKEAAW